MDWTNEHFLWASMVWGVIASGYLVYGWRQKAAIPFAGGAVMLFASMLLPALWMTLVCLAAIAAVWWLLKNGY